MLGVEVMAGSFENSKERLFFEKSVPAGVYVLSVFDSKRNNILSRKILKE